MFRLTNVIPERILFVSWGITVYVCQIAAHLPESPPNIETHDVQPEEVGKKCEESDETCKETRYIAGRIIALIIHLKYWASLISNSQARQLS